jgi:hypothetical protein
MNWLTKFMEFLDANRASPTDIPPWPGPNPEAQPEPMRTTDPAGVGNVERKRISFTQVGPGDTIHARDDEWFRNGDVLEGVSHEVRIITGSGDITDPSNLKIICSQCLKAESVEIRSSISNVPLCRTCQRTLTMPDGTVKILTPVEYAKELDRYDTWKVADNNRNPPRR